MGMVVCDGTGVLILAGVYQGMAFHGPEYVEAPACKWTMKQALDNELSSIIIEGDYLSLITKLKKREYAQMMLSWALLFVIFHLKN